MSVTFDSTVVTWDTGANTWDEGAESGAVARLGIGISIRLSIGVCFLFLVCGWWIH